VAAQIQCALFDRRVPRYGRAVRTFFVALGAAVAGVVLSCVGGDFATRAHGVSNIEGGRAMLVAFAIAPAGALVAFITGFVTARKIRAPGFVGYVKAQLAALALVTALAFVVFGYAVWRAPRPPLLDGQPLALDFEVRMPDGRAAPSSMDLFSVLMTSNGQGDDRHLAELRWEEVGKSDGRVVIPASARLHTTTRERFLVVNDVGGAFYWFDLPLAAHPRHEDESWSAWWPKAGETATRDIHGNGGFQIRYRVRKIAP
jgi:hypothetical protein